MKKSTRISAGAGILALGALVAATPRYLFPVDEFSGLYTQLPNGMSDFMHCHYALMASYLMAPLIGIIGITLMLAKTREAVQLLSVIMGGAFTAVLLIPVVFPMCANPDHPCNRGTKPLLMVLGMIGMMMSGWMAFSSRRSTQYYSAPAHDAA